MAEHTVMRLTPSEWEALGTLVSAAASIVSAVVVIFLARYTYKYMRSTETLVDAAKVQTEASLKQAEIAQRTLDVLLLERKEEESYQRAVFQTVCRDLTGELHRLEAVVKSSAKPFRQRDLSLVPDQWDECRAYITRNAPQCLPAMLALETNLPNDAEDIMGVVRAPDSLWVTSTDRRMKIVRRLGERRVQVEDLQRNVLASAEKRQLISCEGA